MAMDLKLAPAVARSEAIWSMSALRILYEPTLRRTRCHPVPVATIHPFNDLESEVQRGTSPGSALWGLLNRPVSYRKMSHDHPARQAHSQPRYLLWPQK